MVSMPLTLETHQIGFPSVATFETSGGPLCVAAPTLVLLDTSHQRLEAPAPDDPIHRSPAKPAHRGQPHSPVGRPAGRSLPKN